MPDVFPLGRSKQPPTMSGLRSTQQRRSLRPPSLGTAGEGPTPRHRRQDPTTRRRRAHQRPRKGLCTQEGSQQGTHRAGGGDRHRADGPHGHRPLLSGPPAGRGRGHHPVPEQGPLRVLDRHRTHRRILRRPGPAPTIPGRKPADQPGPAHHGASTDPQPQRRTGLLRAEEDRRQSTNGAHEMRQAQALRHRLPTDAQRRDATQRDEPGRTPGNDN